jgi:putative oxygen-independent coproporphyrinogen III oxidase
VHIPFCAHRCDYCSFSVFTDRHHLHQTYVDALLREIAGAASRGAAFETVFVGGGTPSMLSPTLLASVLRALPVAPGAEVTVECNPDDVSASLLDALLDAGLTRISLGVQSTVDHVLNNLGRRHDRAAVASAVTLLRESGVPSYNVDLIYGAANESVDDWRTTLSDAVEFGTTHVSAYALTVEGGTALAADPLRQPDDDDQADKYELAHELLGEAGFANYEVSNWARPGFECAHNWRYWNQGEYLGFGCAAHSHVDGTRWWNVRTPDRYIERISSGSDAISTTESLSGDQRALEALQLSLRTRLGVPASAFSPTDLLDFVDGGLVDVVGDRALLTVRGRLMANALSHRLRSLHR